MFKRSDDQFVKAATDEKFCGTLIGVQKFLRAIHCVGCHAVLLGALAFTAWLQLKHLLLFTDTSHSLFFPLVARQGDELWIERIYIIAAIVVVGAVIEVRRTDRNVKMLLMFQAIRKASTQP